MIQNTACDWWVLRKYSNFSFYRLWQCCQKAAVSSDVLSRPSAWNNRTQLESPAGRIHVKFDIADFYTSIHSSSWVTFDNRNVLGAPKNICGNIAESLLEIQNVLAKFCREIRLTRLVPVFLRQLCSVWCSWSCLSPTWCDQTCDANKTWLAWSIIILITLLWWIIWLRDNHKLQ